MTKKQFLDVEDLVVYQRLCLLHLKVCKLTGEWPREERYELASQVRRSSNSAPAQLAEKNDDRHIRNKIEGINISRGEANETIHHLYIAKQKSYISEDTYHQIKIRYKECIRMLNGLERTLEKKLPSKDRRWQLDEPEPEYDAEPEFQIPGWPQPQS